MTALLLALLPARPGSDHRRVFADFTGGLRALLARRRERAR